ncbi:MarR family transcriptional regulator [Nocardioides gansuensis]|uniref:MarR family transcriptional regulator n=1 Tax=Nocardioides gansuensis TaxID=2138300 RepID=A0A2T8F686_9ACTN|nr:MarR family transcriptional regulator [Nocardioides gansuensis]PVG81224.1 MarR family transcriptional regulator [Nocardioides gansuensis]
MVRQDDLRRLELEMGVLLRRIKRVLHERATQVHPDLQPAAYLLLAHLTHNGPARASEISDVFALDKGAVSRHVQHLVELGLIERRRDPDDGRATILVPTPDGEARVAAVAVARRQQLEERLEGWSDSDLTTFIDGLSRYNRTLE